MNMIVLNIFKNKYKENVLFVNKLEYFVKNSRYLNYFLIKLFSV